ncbi:MAG: class I SAM-dependent methyltransferase [Acidimicrobiia bacterium]|nr:class I SAM-dependent methyltransferase [Acidimicrobiia bacterium]
MGDFSAEWLTLREPADRQARSVELLGALVEKLGPGRVRDERTLSILDLGTGTGANVRYVAPHLSSRAQCWCLVDRDADLLHQLPQHIAAWALDRGAIVSGGSSSFVARGPTLDCLFETRTADLSRLADDALFGPLFEGRQLVTASALLDLVSERWLELLVDRCAAGGTPVLFALTYDGRMACRPEDPDDAWIRSLVNRHQQTNKGFGRALGPDAAMAAIRLFGAAGYEVASAPSDWVLGGAAASLQRPLLEGWATAAAEIARGEGPRVRDWLTRRLAQLDAGVSELIVGHQDCTGWPR